MNLSENDLVLKIKRSFCSIKFKRALKSFVEELIFMILAIFGVLHEFDTPLVQSLLGVSTILVFLAFINNLGNIFVNDLSWWST